MLLVFDWDGTLSDSTGTIVTAMQRAADDLGWQVPEVDAVRNIIGLGLPEALQRLFVGIGDTDVARMRERYGAHYLALDQANPAAFYPGVLDTLDSLRGDGYQLAVATGKSRQGLDRVFKAVQMENFFHASRCADETASKPDPLMLLELIEHFGADAERALMVGDTEYDMEMAERAGVHRIAVSYGAHAPERLAPFKPALCMDCFTELLGWEELARWREG
ncbi:MAG TPA: HAD-IA family hydrolase [Cellvibrionaceae bacterium]